jgi:hypothetical protein
MKCMGDFGALSPEQRTRLRQREPAMVRANKANILYYSEPVKSNNSVNKNTVSNSASLKSTPEIKSTPVSQPQKAPVSQPQKAPGFFARLFGIKPQPSKVSVVTPRIDALKAVSAPVSANQKKSPGLPTGFIAKLLGTDKKPTKAPVQMKKPLPSTANKKMVSQKSVASSAKKKPIKSKGMSGNYYLGDFAGE